MLTQSTLSLSILEHQLPVYENAQTIKAARRMVPDYMPRGSRLMNSHITRRALVRGGLITGALIPIAGFLVNKVAIAAPAALDPSDPTAKTLGYVTKSAKADQQCNNCAQFQGKSADSQGNCTLFPGKTVASGGWCMSWVKKLPT
jgi:hypothetical protein